MAKWLMRADAIGRWLRNGGKPLTQKHARYNVLAGSGLFDGAWYMARYRDVATLGWDPIDHYLLHGADEGRDPSPFFSTRFYLDHYSDVVDAQLNPLVDFIECGALKRRNPSAYFDCDWYLNMYRDVADAGFNPLRHYTQYGEAEGRWPNPSFSPRFYKMRYLSDEPSTASPLEHYIRVGQHQGLDTKESSAERYQHVTLLQEQSLCAEFSEIERHVRGMTLAPHFFIYGEGGATTDSLNLTAQIYPSWTLCGDKDELLSLVKQQGDAPWFIIWASSDDVFHRAMLYRFACEYECDPDVEVIYADDDVLNDDGRRIHPFYKPDWSPDYLESCNYIGAAACVGGALAHEILRETESQYDFLLRATETARQIVHVAIVLAHRKRPLDSARTELEQQSDLIAISNALKRAGRQGVVTQLRPNLACYRVAPTVSSLELPISIVIPTAGKDVILKGELVDLITTLVSQIRAKAAYQSIEIIAVVNEDMADEKISALHDMGVLTVVYRHEEVNIAKKINLGASIAHRKYLLLMNDDIEPVSSDWIEQMLAQFDKPHVGVVGAKLLYGDMKIQHVGVVLNSGNPDHPRSRYPHDDDGYFFSSIATRNFLAVTGAVMLTPRSLFEAVGGFTPDLAISYNDVDYCLKLREIGKVTVYCPAATLLHYESLSRTRTLNMSEMYYFHERWAYIARDPFYNEEFLTMAPPTFEVCNNRKLIG